MNKSESLDSLVELYFSKNSNGSKKSSSRSSQKTLVPSKKSTSSSTSTLRGSTRSSRSSQKTLVPPKKSSNKIQQLTKQKNREEEYRDLVNEYADDIMYLRGMKNVLNSTIKDKGSKLTKSQLFNLTKIADEYEIQEQQKLEAQKRVIDDLKKIREQTKMTNALNKSSSSTGQQNNIGSSNKKKTSALGALKRAFSRRN